MPADHYRPTSETAFKWPLADEPIVTRDGMLAYDDRLDTPNK